MGYEIGTHVDYYEWDLERSASSVMTSRSCMRSRTTSRRYSRRLPTWNCATSSIWRLVWA